MGTTTEIGAIAQSLSVEPLSLTPRHFPKTPISVCHLISGDAWGGAEAQVTTLVRALSKRRDIDLCAILLNEGRVADELRACAIDLKVIPERRNSFWKIVSQARAFLRGRDIQVLHAHRYKENLIGALLALGEPGMCLVKTQHGRPETLTGFAGVKQRLAHAVDRATMRRATDKVISVSSQLTGYLKQYVSSERVAVIPNGIDLAEVKCDLSPAEAKERIAISQDAPVVGFVGRIERVKRLDLFVQTAAQIRTQLPRTKFVVAGNGREEMTLRQLVANEGLDTSFILLGHRQDTCELLRAMDLLLLTSDHEGLPMVVLEAMALGTVVVAHEVGGIPEIVTDRQTGLLFNDRSPSAIARLCVSTLQNARLRESLARAARKVIESQYAAEHNGARVFELYASLVGVDGIGHEA
jgi:L-malate glycosyltransferase